MRPRKPILLFALRVLAWLAPCLAAWYWLAPWLDRLPVWLAQGLLALYRGGLVAGVEFDGRLLEFVTTIPVRQAGQAGVLVVEVNPLLSTFGAPFLATLVLASRGGWRRLLLGLALLVPFQAWSIAFDFIAQILRTDRELVVQAGLAGWRAEFAALAYQLGSLIFPTLAPVACWVAMQWRYVQELAGFPGVEPQR